MVTEKFDYKEWLDEQDFEAEAKEMVWRYGHPKMTLQDAEQIVKDIMAIFYSYKPSAPLIPSPKKVN